jgi:hypothetical protein
MSSEAINAWIRNQAGRNVPPAAPMLEPVGDVGIGKGGSARPTRASTSTNDGIRRAAAVARSFTVPGGVRLDDLDLDDLLS